MIAAEVVRLRKKLGLTQAQLGERIGVHQVTVARWETGAYPISRRTEIQLRPFVEAARRWRAKT